jgi:hypothetical protein
MKTIQLSEPTPPYSMERLIDLVNAEKVSSWKYHREFLQGLGLKEDPASTLPRLASYSID